MSRFRSGEERGLEKIKEISDKSIREALRELWLYELDEADQKSKAYKEAYKSVIRRHVENAEDDSQ